MKTVLKAVLIIISIITLGYFVFDNIIRPTQFEKQKKVRYNSAIEKLKDIRKAQIVYKDVKGRYTSSLDTLIDFVKYDSLKFVHSIGALTDSMIQLGWNEDSAIVKGILIRDTLRISVLDSVFSKIYPIDELKYVPVPDTIVQFLMESGTSSANYGVVVPTFEAKVHNNLILRGLNHKLIIKLNEDKRKNNEYPGLKVGALEEPSNNAGNWE